MVIYTHPKMVYRITMVETKDISNLVLSQTEQRALNLLGQGIEPSIVASAVGVTEARISQLVSDPHFAARVAELRYVNLAKHSDRDREYDDLEDTLIDKLKDLMVYMSKPMEVLAAIRVINQAKRRSLGVSSELTQGRAQVVQLVLPIQIVNQFKLNSNNQVIQAGTQELITIQSGQLKTLALKGKGEPNVELLSSSNQSNERPRNEAKTG